MVPTAQTGNGVFNPPVPQGRFGVSGPRVVFSAAVGVPLVG